MVGRVLLLLLLASSASAQEAEGQDAHMYQAQKTEMVGYPNWVLSPLGRERIAAALQKQAEDIAAKEAEAAKLRADVVTLSAKPELTWTGAAILIGIGILAGAAIAVPIGLAARK